MSGKSTFHNKDGVYWWGTEMYHHQVTKETAEIMTPLIGSGKIISDADRSRLFDFDPEVLQTLVYQILKDDKRTVRTIVKKHMDKENKIRMGALNKEHPDVDYCMVTPFYPKIDDLTMCPCGCNWGYCTYNSTWYDPGDY